MMACHALALGLNEDNLIVTILLHDICEDCFDGNGGRVQPNDLPVNDEIKEAVKLLTKPEIEYDSYRDDYFNGIKTNRLAVIVKSFDRCNNISTMATGLISKKSKNI